MKLQPELQKLLLELATIERVADTGVKAPEPTELTALNKAQAELDRARQAHQAAQMAVDDMELEILRIQEDERKLRRREADDKQQLSAATDPEVRKDLEKDRYAAKSRIANLMSELAEAHNQIHALRNNADINKQRVRDCEAKVAAAQEAVDALGELNTEAEHQARVDYIRSQLPADVMAEFYERRAENSVGVASFNGRSCGGCFIVLPPSDISAIRNAPVDELPQCPDCGSYLVRAAA